VICYACFEREVSLAIFERIEVFLLIILFFGMIVAMAVWKLRLFWAGALIVFTVIAMKKRFAGGSRAKTNDANVDVETQQDVLGKLKLSFSGTLPTLLCVGGFLIMVVDMLEKGPDTLSRAFVAVGATTEILIPAKKGNFFSVDIRRKIAMAELKEAFNGEKTRSWEEDPVMQELARHGTAILGDNREGPLSEEPDSHASRSEIIEQYERAKAEHDQETPKNTPTPKVSPTNSDSGEVVH
jgi:hypothetical protein